MFGGREETPSVIKRERMIDLQIDKYQRPIWGEQTKVDIFGEKKRKQWPLHKLITYWKPFKFQTRVQVSLSTPFTRSCAGQGISVHAFEFS